MRFAALGRTQWLYDAIRAAVAAGHKAVLIGTCSAAPEYTLNEGDFGRLAKELGCPFFADSAINRPEYVKMARECEAEVALSVNWLTLIGQQMLDQFKYGIINAHAGDLPRFRGNAAPNWAILVDEPKIVLTLHQMVAELDAGPIFLQKELRLTPDTYIAEIYEFLAVNIPQMFVEVMNNLTAGTLVARNQQADKALSLRCFPRLPRDGEVDWNRDAVELARLVRANSKPLQGAYSFLGKDKVTLWRAHPEQLPYPFLGTPGQVAEIRLHAGEVAVLTGNGVLVLEEIETASTGSRRAADIIKSHRMRLGMNVLQEIQGLDERIAQLEAQLQELRAQKSI